MSVAVDRLLAAELAAMRDAPVYGAGVVKSDSERQYVLGVAYQAGQSPLIKTGADGFRDFISESELEKAAWSFLPLGGHVGLFHEDGTVGHATVVESYIFRGEPWSVGDAVVKAGDWLVGAVLDDVAWGLYKAGHITGWSPQGGARRRMVAAAKSDASIAKALGDVPGLYLFEAPDDEFTELTDAAFPRVDLVGKAANGLSFLIAKSDPTHVVKAGRVLSAANEALIRSAMQNLETVVASLPPETPTLKGTGMSKTATVAKTKEDPAVPVYDQGGSLVGIVDPDKIQELQPGTPIGSAKPNGPVDTAAAPSDLNPAPAAEVGTSKDEATKSAARVRDASDALDRASHAWQSSGSQRHLVALKAAQVAYTDAEAAHAQILMRAIANRSGTPTGGDTGNSFDTEGGWASVGEYPLGGFDPTLAERVAKVAKSIVGRPGIRNAAEAVVYARHVVHVDNLKAQLAKAEADNTDAHAAFDKTGPTTAPHGCA